MVTRSHILVGSKSAAALIERADYFLFQSRNSEYLEDSMESAYNAALKAVGVFLLTTEQKVPRKLLKASVWSKLRYFYPTLGDVVDFFEQQSPVVKRVGMGLEVDLDSGFVSELYTEAENLVELAKVQLRNYTAVQSAA